MKKISKISSLILSTLVLSACSQTANIKPAPTEATPAPTSYENKELGIKFQYSGTYAGQASQEGNKIAIKDAYLQVFTKLENQKIEDAILDVVKKANKDTSKCKVVDNGNYWAKDTFKNYKLDLVNQKITYTKEEEAKIKQADADAKKDGGPFDGEWEKTAVYNARLIDTCGTYADPLGLATSKTSPSIFLYDEKSSKTKFIFIAGSADPYFFKEDSLEILN